MTTIAAALASLKAATDIAKALRESDRSLERAELKLKLAELVGSLAEAKIQLAEVQDLLAAKDRTIAELQEAFESKDTLVRHRDAYYSVDAAGRPAGVPYCLRCWESDHRRRQLVHDARDHRSRFCTACKTQYPWRSVPDIQMGEGAEDA
jgi:hypothetical protein